MLDNVVLVGGLKNVADHSKWPDLAAPVRRDEPGYLEVDQMRETIVAQEDVLSLLQVDISRAAGMDGVNEGRQPREEFIVNRVILLQRPPLNVVVQDAGPAKPTAKRRDSRDSPHQVEEPGLVIGQKSADPRHRKSEECRCPSHFEHDLVGLSLIKSRDSEEIMLERFIKTELSTFNVQNFRQVVRAQRAKPGSSRLLLKNLGH